MLLLSFTSSARSFELKKLHTYWECKVSTGFAKLNFEVAFATLFRNSSDSGMSPKKVTRYNTDSSHIENPPCENSLADALGYLR